MNLPMRDKRSVDDLSIEELERVLAIKKREARQSQLKRMKREGRMVVTAEPKTPPATPEPVAMADPVANGTNGNETNGHHPPTVDKPALKKAAPRISKPGVPRFEDDIEDVAAVAGVPQKDDRAWRRFVNGSLLLVEVAAVIGLFSLGFMLVTARGDLESETRAAQEMSNATRVASIPTLAPTPTVRMNDVVLPGGHVIENGVPKFNESEIPARYRSQLAYEYSRPVLERPAPTDQTAQVVSIPELGIDESIVQGSDWEALRLGVGQVLNGFDPSHPEGNVVLSAHNDIYAELFRDLDQLEIGDLIYIRTNNRVYTYQVTRTLEVDPTDVWVLESQGKQMATLISCYPHGVNNKRYIVFADLVEST